MFKIYVYNVYNKLYPIKDSYILVPGCGYGRNICQLASFRPKEIIAFDIYPTVKNGNFFLKLLKKV